MFRNLEKIQQLKNIPRGLKHYCSGMYSGLIVVTVYTPMELVKMKMQIDTRNLNSIKTVSNDIYNKFGLRGFYKGYAVTLNRDFFSYGAYFYVYFKLKEHWEEKNSLTSFKLFFAGGMAGVISWIICYPFDPMKTLIQTSFESRTITQKEAYLFIKNNYGMNGFFRGMSPVLLKAFIQHGVIFKTTEHCRNYLRKHFT